jgi:hypothetical protein
VKRLTGYLLLFFMIACSDRTGIPNDIIPTDSMRLIMKDIIIAEQYSELFVKRDSLRKDKKQASQQLLDEIFKIHHITREDFKKSLIFYESRPDLNKKIFDSLTADANRRKTELYLPKPVVTPKPAPAK